MPQKLSFFIYLLDITFQTPIPYSSTTHSFHPLQHWTSLVYPLLKILTGNFTSPLSLSQLPQSWAFCIVSASFSPPLSRYPYIGALSALVWSTHDMCGGSPRTQLSWTECSLRLFVLSVLLLSLTIFSLLNSAAKLLLSISSIVIFTLTALLNLLTACLPPLLRPRCTRLCTQAHPFTDQIPYARVKQHLHSFIPFTGKLGNNLPFSVFTPAYELNSFKRKVSGHLSSWIWSLVFDTHLLSSRSSK